MDVSNPCVPQLLFERMRQGRLQTRRRPYFTYFEPRRACYLMAARCSDEDKKYNETFFDSINRAAK